MATIKIKIKNGECDATVKGTAFDIVEGLATMLIGSPEMLRFMKAAIEVSEEHNKELNEENNN
ncbi:hypothetical protein BZARG_754 [Bizionia argentinensis JUB59]|uniref:Uncharacterized protein n=1 Tax=Bizionia argentinensis JUB59 TaxID=1046627 RepID=G2EB71_9FLAO|nr:hypothetical protein [Bizionia argentinensis]EGV44417.1 hypothetical protein BZARG_754 [Bizionia argentinensis JUB59]